MPSFTYEQVQQHTKPDDVWIVLHNKSLFSHRKLIDAFFLTYPVYDVTKYLDDHPGGKDVLLEAAGTDATEAFEDVGHSDEAREQLDPYYIGDLPTEVFLIACFFL